MARGGKREGAGRPKGSGKKQAPPVAAADDEMRGKVALCAADGMDPTAIAIALGISETALRASYAREIDYGRIIIRAEQLAALSAAARDGNAAAAKALLGIATKSETVAPARGGGGDDLAGRALRILQGGKK